MNKSSTIGMALVAALVALPLLSRTRRHRLGALLSRRLRGHMQRMMASLPEDSPPRLVMSVLPRLREQNEQIIQMIREQDALMRDYLQRPR